MKHLELINALESTNKTNAKIDAIIDYLERAPDEDKVWFIALFTGKRPKRNVNTNYMKEWALEITNYLSGCLRRVILRSATWEKHYL